MKAGVGAAVALLNTRGKMHGFTIVETMVVLAVTGALFVVVAATLSGRQNAAEFTHAIQSVQSQLQQIIDQVPDGFFPSSTISCSNAAGVPAFGTTGSQGTNAECEFLGKVVQFQVNGTDPEQYQVYTIAGLNNNQGTIAVPFAGAAPAVVAAASDYASYSTAVNLQYGLQTVWMKSEGNNIGAVGFLMEPGKANGGSPTGYSSGAQQVDLVPLRSVHLDEGLTTAVGQIQDNTLGSGGLRDTSLLTAAPINPPDGVQICFASGTTGQSGLVTIGSTGRQLLVKLQIKSNATCA